MAFGAYNATTAETVLLAAAGWSVGQVYNASDAVVYAKYTDDATALTTANGIPIAVGGTLKLVARDSAQQPPVRVIHGGSGNKDIRYAFH